VYNKCIPLSNRNIFDEDKTKKLLRKILGSLLIVIVSLITTWSVLPVIEIVSAATCSGSGCDNTNPHDTGCDSGTVYVPESIYNPGQRLIELRLSSVCGTYWTRVTNYYASNKYVKAHLAGFYTIGPELIGTTQYKYTNQQYTPPYAGFNWQACGYVLDAPSPGVGDCTP
jgi:hypothetical protein